MNLRFIVIGIMFTVITAAGCKVRRISDGKPPRDGVLKKEVTDPRYGVLQTEEHYKEGRLTYEKGTFRSGVTAFERFKETGSGTTDSNVSFYPSGRLSVVMVLSGERLISVRDYFESGALRSVTDTVETNEFYPSGKKRARTRFTDGSVTAIEWWHENGTRMEFSEWQNDLRHGKRLEWDSTGRQTVNETYRNGTALK